MLAIGLTQGGYAVIFVTAEAVTCCDFRARAYSDLGRKIVVFLLCAVRFSRALLSDLKTVRTLLLGGVNKVWTRSSVGRAFDS